MNIRTFIAVAALAAAVPAAAQETYAFDPSHSHAYFEVGHLGGYSLQRGGFEKVSGKVTLDRAAKKGSVDVTIDGASLRTFDARVDAALKGEKYFNVEKYPTLGYKSSGLQFDGDKLVAIDGDFTMLGVTKPVRLQVTRFQCGENPFNKKQMCGAEASGTIKRSEWGMTNGIPMSSTDEVKISIPIEAYKE